MVAFLPSLEESLSENKAREEQSQEMEGMGRGGKERGKGETKPL